MYILTKLYVTKLYVFTIMVFVTNCLPYIIIIITYTLQFKVRRCMCMYVAIAIIILYMMNQYNLQSNITNGAEARSCTCMLVKFTTTGKHFIDPTDSEISCINIL